MQTKGVIQQFKAGNNKQMIMALKMNEYLTNTYPDLYTNPQLTSNTSDTLYSKILGLGELTKKVAMEVV